MFVASKEWNHNNILANPDDILKYFKKHIDNTLNAGDDAPCTSFEYQAAGL